ncbi:uncharacterized protein LOC128852925 isoform X2 [Cuculus canorus]|uniref:uncharacterized protein LOC128852925 isoform X2 n=1 Tax=Cuculus canorus TaxID=55661 RepID=UPI0023AA6051|nr:uncharacterized protein LOC128852925 isoform X2 [Cuculus canorus]
MEGTLLRLAAACCLLCALPGEGQKTAEISVTPSPSLSTVLTSHQPKEASDFSPVTAAIPETILEKNLTTSTHNASGNNATEMENASIPTTPVVVSETERLQASATASPRNVTVTQHEHHNVSFSLNSGTEIPSPTPTASTLEENQHNHEVTEPSSTTEEEDDANSATPTPSLNSVLGEGLSLLPVQKVLTPGCTTWKLLNFLGSWREGEKGNEPLHATTNSSQLGSFDGQTMRPTAARPETRPGTSPVGATEESSVEPRTSSAPISTVGSTSSATTSSTVTVGTPVTSSTPTSTAAIPGGTSTLEQPLEPIHEKASVLDVGDDENPELPSSPLADTTRADPLVISVISVFIVVVGVLGLVGFLRYRQHNSRVEFRRLQDLPMVPLLPSRV